MDIEKILNETDVDVLQALKNENHTARNEFFADTAMRHPNGYYPHLERTHYENSLRRIEECRQSGEMQALPFYERQLAEMILDLNQKKHSFLLAVCDYRTAKSAAQKEEAKKQHQAAGLALFGAPDKAVFDAMLSMLLARIRKKTLSAAEQQAYHELMALLPVHPADTAPAFHPDPEVLQQFSQLVRDFYAPLLRHIPDCRETFTIQEAADIAAEIIRTELQEYGEKWSVYVEPGRTNCAVNQEKRCVLFPAARVPDQYTRPDLMKILIHEVGVHVMRAMPYQNMKIQAFSRGFPDYAVIEEGIAKLMEQGITGEYQEAGIVHYITAGLAHFFGLDFRQIFEIQKRLQGLSSGISEIICYNSVQRAFRGTDVLPIYKDIVYYHGSEQLWQYVAAHIDDPMLFDHLILSGKTDIFQTEQNVLVYEAKCGKFSRSGNQHPI